MNKTTLSMLAVSIFCIGLLIMPPAGLAQIAHSHQADLKFHVLGYDADTKGAITAGTKNVQLALKITNDTAYPVSFQLRFRQYQLRNGVNSPLADVVSFAPTQHYWLASLRAHTSNILSLDSLGGEIALKNIDPTKVVDAFVVFDYQGNSAGEPGTGEGYDTFVSAEDFISIPVSSMNDMFIQKIYVGLKNKGLI